MLEFPAVVDVPLKVDDDGAIRVGGTRILLEVVIGAHQRGDTAEQIAQAFDVLKLEDVYAVIAYYLSHRMDVDAYMRQVDEVGEELRRKFEALPSYKPLTRAVLQARLEEKREKAGIMRFLADENFNNDLLRGLIKAAPDLDIIRVQDTEIYQADDPTVLEWAAKEERILLTHDVRTMPEYVFERLEAGLSVPGIIEVKRDIPFREAIDDLMVMIGAGDAADFENQVRYVPMR